MTTGVNTLEGVSLGDRFDAEIENIKFDFKGRCPNGPGVDAGTRLDHMSHFSDYFMRHFQAALEVLEDKNATPSDIDRVNKDMDALAWTDNYFLETYNEFNRRDLERHITSILSSTGTTQRNISSICLMLKMQIDAEYKRIQEAQGQLDAAERSSNILDTK